MNTPQDPRAKGRIEASQRQAGQAKTVAVAFELEAHHTTCRFKKPLVIVSGLPGDGAEIRPAALRAFARMLLEAADDAERIAKNGDEGGCATYSVEVAL